MSKLVNKNIIRAMSIGLSAVMTAGSMSLSAFAEESTTIPTDDNNVNENESAVAKTELDIAEEAAESAKVEVYNSIENEENSIKAAVGAAEGLTDEGVVLAVGAINTELDGGENQTSDGKVDAEASMIGYEAQLENLEGQQSAIDTQVKAYNDAIEDANDAADAADEAAKEAKEALGIGAEANILDVVNGAQDVLNESKDTIEKTDDETEANAAFQDAKDAVTDASNKVDKAETDFNLKKDAYEKAVAAYEEALRNQENADAALFGTVSEDGTVISTGLVGGYNDIQSDANDEKAAASAELARLAEEAAALKEAADEAKNAYLESQYAHIAALEAAVEERPDFSTTYRELAKAMAKYYVVDVLGGTILDDNIPWVDTNDLKKQGYTSNVEYEVDGRKVSDTPGNVLKYGTLKYKVGDEEKELLFNYKTTDRNNTNAKKIVVFEKTKHNVIGAEELTDEQLATLETEPIFNDDHTSVLVKEGNNYVRYSLSEVDVDPTIGVALGFTEYEVDEERSANATADSTVQLNDGKGSYKEIHTEMEISTKTYTETVGDTVVTYSYDDVTGNVVKTETANLSVTPYEKRVTTTTTTTYTGNSLDASETTYSSIAAAEEAYIEALQAKIDVLADGETLVIGSGETAVTFTKGDTVTEAVGFDYESEKHDAVVEENALLGYTVEGNYAYTFSKQVTITEKCRNMDEAEAFFNNFATSHTGEMVVDNTGWFGFGIIGGDYYGTKIVELEGSGGISRHGNKYSKTYTVYYENVASMKKDYSDWFGGDKELAELTAATQNEITSAGNVYLEHLDTDGNPWKTTFLYSPGTALENAVELDETDESKLSKALVEYLEAQGIHAGDVTITSSNERRGEKIVTPESFTYGYKKLDYFIKTIQTITEDPEEITLRAYSLENQILSTTVLNKTQESSNVLKVQYRNDNWYTGDILIAEYDNDGNVADYTTDKNGAKYLTPEQAQITKDFRDKVDGTTALIAKYQALSEQADAAQKAVEAAKAKVDALTVPDAKVGIMVADLSDTPSVDDLKLIRDLAKDQLVEAQKILDDAIAKRDSLLEQLADLEGLLTAKIAELNTETTTVTTTVAAAPAETPAPAAVVPGVIQIQGNVAPQAPAAPADNADNGEAGENNFEDIGNEVAALTNGIGDGNGGKKTESIGPEESALAMGLDEVAPKRRWNWWWLLIVAAVTGGTTYGIVKGNQKKKEEENKEI